MLKNFICLAIFVGFLFQFAYSLSCYHCNSNLNEGCNEMLQPIQIMECKSNETTRRNHQKLAEALKVSIASKSKLYCLTVFLNDKHGDKQTYRECYEDYNVYTPCEMVTKSLTNDNDHIRVENCEICADDLCNGDKLLSQSSVSSSLPIYFDTRLVLVLFGVIYLKF